MKFFIELFLMCCIFFTFSVMAKEGDANSSNVIILAPVKFTGKMQVEKVAYECSMLKMATDAFLKSAKALSLNVEYQENVDMVLVDKILVIELADVNANKWRPMSFRPYSDATIKATLLKNGAVVDVFSKKIHSAIALGACDRLEKIATAGGKDIAKWVSKNRYQASN